MQKIGDKIIYNTIEILDPSHTALVVWEVQNLNVSRIFKEEFISDLSLIIELARKATVPIFFTRIQVLPMRFESSGLLGWNVLCRCSITAKVWLCEYG